MFVRLQFVITFFAVVTTTSAQFQDEFHEELFLKPLPTGHINSFFQFSTEWTLNRKESRRKTLNQLFLVPRTPTVANPISFHSSTH